MRREVVSGHRRARRLAAVALAVVVAGCAGDGPLVELPEPVPEPTTLDGVVGPMLTEAGIVAVEASRVELCRRLAADLLGRFPSASEVETECADRAPAEIAERFQARPEYVRRSLRTWRDRLGTSDDTLDYRHLAALFELAAALHREELRLDDFTIAVLSDPGFLLQEADVVARASRVHQVFLGRRPTTEVANDLAQLVRIWEPVAQEEYTIGLAFQTTRAFVVPGRCAPLGRCETRLLEGGVIDLQTTSPFPFVPIRYESLTEEQRLALDGLGALIVRQPEFWEAAADEILDRLLGWNDGGSMPRRPGTLLPRVRRLVADHLRETGSVASAERLVIASLLYRQTARADVLAAADQEVEDRPVWATGPVKYTLAEVVLDTAGLPGTCDPRYPDHTYFDRHRESLGTLDQLDSYEVVFAELVERTGHWNLVVQREVLLQGQLVPISVLDTTYRDLARLFGGCPGVASPRSDGSAGLAYAYGNELAVRQVCDAIDLGDVDRPLDAIVNSVVEKFLSRPASFDEQIAFAEAACTDCDPSARARGICVAVLGSHEMLLY